ncbi:tRNA(Ile)-lysidine synthase [Fructilactobacillus fructivorans]|nr:tRNA(Ile)-lysidine synthase [Fructilactobacillus fructivorans]KRN43000.1 tRNA(Ile)-lysidine synthase [Fructilactobacillus fructivorans]
MLGFFVLEVNLNLQRQINSLINKEHWWNEAQPVVVGVSTGVDSMVLLNSLEHLPKLIRPRIIVAHVNHHLREQSTIEERFITEYCRSHHLELMVGNWDPNDIHSGIEAKARQFRYHFFTEVMDEKGSTILLTAHQANDQAETVLMKLIRSGNLMECQGIQPSRPFHNGKIIRPMLSFSKNNIRAYARSHGLVWYEDETNFGDEVLRNRIRNQILPNLMKENPQVISHLANFAKNLQSEIAGAEELASTFLQHQDLKVKNDRVSAQSDLVKTDQLPILLRTLLKKLTTSVTLSDNQITEIMTLVKDFEKPQGKLQISNAYFFEKSYNSIMFFKQSPNNYDEDRDKSSFVVKLNTWNYDNNGFNFGIFDKNHVPKGKFDRVSYFDLATAQFPLSIRSGQPTDTIELKNGGHQSLRRLLINQKVPSEKRRHVKVLVDSKGQVLAIIGYKESRKSSPSATNGYELLVTRKDVTNE